jgi:leucyl/phenylalanyl-tRNA--protein transferase
MLTWLTRDSLTFPPLKKPARPQRPAGRRRRPVPDRLIQAYRHGCFPWFRKASRSLVVARPAHRAVPDELHVSRSLANYCASNATTSPSTRDFAGIRACAAPRDYADGTWITEPCKTPTRAAPPRPRPLGGVWDNGNWSAACTAWRWVKLFFGESMFSRADNASKVGFVTLVSI